MDVFLSSYYTGIEVWHTLKIRRINEKNTVGYSLYYTFSSINCMAKDENVRLNYLFDSNDTGAAFPDMQAGGGKNIP